VPKQDISRRAVTRASKLINNSLTNTGNLLPFGPDKEEFSEGEVDKMIEEARAKKQGGVLLELMQSLGQQRVMDSMMGKRNGA